jgi:hypothetical protein
MSEEKKYKCQMCDKWFPMKELKSHFNLSRICPTCLDFCKKEDEEEEDFFQKVDEIHNPNTSEARRKEIFNEFTGDNEE